MSSGLRMVPDMSLADAPERIDTLVDPGRRGFGGRERGGGIAGLAEARPRPARAAWRRYARARSCSPPPGLLDGRRATTHWASAARLAERYPAVEVDPDPIYVRDGDVWTSAGVTAGMDLALALVEEDLDRDAALTIARHLVLFLRRPGNQSQFSATLAAQEPEREPLREVQRYVVEHVGGEPLGGGAGRARPHEPAPLRPRLRGRDRDHARTLRRARAPGGGAARAGGHLSSRSRPSRPHAGSARPRRCAARSCARCGVAPAEYRRRFHPDGAPDPGGRQPPDEHDKERSTMDIAILLYDRFTALDAVGPYEVLSRLPGAQVTFVAERGRSR